MPLCPAPTTTTSGSPLMRHRPFQSGTAGAPQVPVEKGHQRMASLRPSAHDAPNSAGPQASVGRRRTVAYRRGYAETAPIGAPGPILPTLMPSVERLEIGG